VDAGGSLSSGQQLSAVINLALNLLKCDHNESAKVLLRAFSSNLPNDWPRSGLGSPDVSQMQSEWIVLDTGIWLD